MSLADDIERLRQIASSDAIPFVALRGLQQQLLDTNATVAGILGPGHGLAHGIGGCAAQVSQKLDEAIAACQEYESAIHDAADLLEQGNG